MCRMSEVQRVRDAVGKVAVNKTCPQAPQNSHGLIRDLWPHQLAMLHRCQQIESKYAEVSAVEFTDHLFNFGVICAVPASGKTALMLALLTSEKKRKGNCGSNLVVVPQGIYSQWVQEIDKFAGDRLTYKPFVEYADISELLYTTEGLMEADLLLTTPMFYQSICRACREANIKFSRVFIDEVDGVNWFLTGRKGKEQITANIVWNVSASFHPSLLMSRHVSYQDVMSRVCDCDPEFVRESLQLTPVDKHLKKCSDPYIGNVLCHVCTREEVLAMNAGDFSWLRPVVNPRLVTNSKDALEVIKSNAAELRGRSNRTHQDLSRRRPMNDDLRRKMQIELDVVAKYDRVLSTIEKHAEKDVVSEHKGKKETVLDLLRTTGKTIVFSGYPQILGGLAEDLKEMNGVKYGQLDGGNVKAIDETIKQYKTGDVRILLSDTSSFGRGLNLEETTDIIFLHKMDSDVEMQVIGRAQRFGRKVKLDVWYLFNEFEMSRS